MTTFTTPRTWNVGELVTKVMLDEQIRDNSNALWPYSAAGDIAYASASNALARLALTVGGVLYGGASAPAWLAKPASLLSYLTNTSAGVPAWASKGIFRHIGYASFAPNQSDGAGSFIDVTNATVTLALTAGNTYTVICLAGVVGSVNNASFSLQVCGHIDGTIDPNQLSFIGTTQKSGVLVGYHRTGIASGNRIVKLQFRCFAAGGTATLDRGWLFALAITE